MNESPARVRQPIDLDEFERRLRSAANPAHADQDPLAELARLVGQGNAAAVPQEQPQLQNSLPSHQALPEPQDYAAPHIHRPDPSFDPRLRDQAPMAERTYSSAPEAQGHESQVPVDMGQIEAQMRDFRRNYEPMANTAPRQEPSFDGQHSVNADPRNADARSYADPRIDSSAYAPEPAYLDDVEVEPKPRRTLWLASAGLVVVMGAIGLGFVYKGGAKLGGEAPTILAAAGPTKVQPPNPTNSDTTNASSTILDKGQADRVTASKIVTREEQPVDLAAQRPIPRDVTAAASPIPAVPAVQYDPNYEPPMETMMEAQKVTKSAASALSFEDVPTAVKYLQDALKMLTEPGAYKKGKR